MWAESMLPGMTGTGDLSAMYSRVRRPAAALAGLAASFSLAAMPSAVAAPAGQPVPLVKEDVGGSELASPGIVVHYPKTGAVPLPQVPASAYVIADAHTGQVLAAEDAHGLFPPASTLKMLTAIALIPRLKPNATVMTSQLAAQTAEYDVGLVAGRRYKVSDLFRALLLISANDAAVALTQATGSLAKGMALINAEAHHLQAYDVVAKQPNGLPADGQVVSAYDEALIARQALAMPAFMKYDSTISAEFPVTPQQQVPLVNQNSLLTKYPGGIGGKIGWTEAAEATYIGMARRNGVTLIVTLLHCTSLQEITSGEKLLDWGFAMDGKVRPVGHLVSPLPAVATSYTKRRPAVGGAGSARPHDATKAGRPAGAHDATRAGRPASTRDAVAAPSAPAVPTLPLAAGGGLLAVAAAGAGWLSRRRKQRPVALAPAPPGDGPGPQPPAPRG
jgi:serine-type D-Ala-D-Ala carboxypeptidase (penicillin-binding protein 5/6)